MVEFERLHGSSGNNYTNTVFDDEAASLITAGTAPFSGSFRPEGSLGGATTLAGSVSVMYQAPTAMTLSGIALRQHLVQEHPILHDQHLAPIGADADDLHGLGADHQVLVRV